MAELNEQDAADLGVSDGQPVELHSPRGVMRAAARIGPLRRGTVFVPFHYGYWDSTGSARTVRRGRRRTS